MAIYHLSTKPISRSSGRSATASIAYRAGVQIDDKRQGKTFDYTKRSGVLHKELLTPNDINISRSDLWNMAELTDTRSNSRTAREFVVNIPHELMTDPKDPNNRGITAIRELAHDLKNQYGVAVDFAIHSPDKQGDNRNYHAHIMVTTRQLTTDKDGNAKLGEKSQLEMSNTQLKAIGKATAKDELKIIREKWATIANNQLEQAGIVERIDHRSHKDRGLDTLPTIKMGWEATELERQGIRTEKGDINREIRATNQRIAELNCEIVFEKGILENYSTLKNLDNASNEQVKNNLTQKDLNEIEHYKGISEVRIARISEKADKEPLTQDDIKTYEQWKMINNSIVELEQTGVLAEKKKTTQEKNQKQSELTAASEPKPQPKTQTPLETHSKRLETQEKQVARVVPPQAEKSLQSENKPHIEPKKINIAENQELLKKYAEKVQTTAKVILDSQLKALRAKAKPILEKYNTLKDNKPLLFGKDKWERDTSNALKQYNAIKTIHDSMKDKGVTDDHYKQAREHIAKHEPSYHAQVQQAIKELESHKKQEQDKYAREHGADKLATNGEYYSGKILKVTEKGAYQQTNKGIVLHPTYANDKTLKLDKSYDLDYRETSKTGQVLRSETYEVRLPSKSQDKNIQR